MIRYAKWAAMLCTALPVARASTVCAANATDLTPLQIQAMEQREFEADKSTVFASVVDVLQDLGFTIGSADLNTGFISAASPVTNTGSTSDLLVWGGSTGNSRVTAFIETMASGRTRVRLNFVSGKNRLGWSYTMEHHEKIVTDQHVYRVAFDKIDEALFVRKSTNSPAPARPAAPVTSAGH